MKSPLFFLVFAFSLSAVKPYSANAGEASDSVVTESKQVDRYGELYNETYSEDGALVEDAASRCEEGEVHKFGKCCKRVPSGYQCRGNGRRCVVVNHNRHCYVVH